jgi:hypothetical protein
MMTIHSGRALSRIERRTGYQWRGIVTLSAISLISAIEQQAKWLKFHASTFAVIGQFRSI